MDSCKPEAANLSGTVGCDGDDASATEERHRLATIGWDPESISFDIGPAQNPLAADEWVMVEAGAPPSVSARTISSLLEDRDAGLLEYVSDAEDGEDDENAVVPYRDKFENMLESRASRPRSSTLAEALSLGGAA